MNEPVLVVVSGLAASGKSTLGAALAERLSWPLFDKDHILEALFDTLGCDHPEQRERLSRASDEVLFRLAGQASRGAVLVNWWRHDTAPPRLRSITHALVEVFCDCPIEVAAARFAERERHRGHLDHLRTTADHEAGVRRVHASFRGPLGLGEEVIAVDTSREVDDDQVAHVVERVRRAAAG